MLPSTFFSLPAQIEVLAAGEVLRRRNQTLTSVLHLESGRVLRGVYEDGRMRHQLGVVEGPFWLDAASAMLEKPFPVDMVAETRVQVRRLPAGKVLDILAPLIPFGQMFGRIGCFGAGCCYGHETDLPWAVTFTDPLSIAPKGVPLHQRKRLIAAQLGIAPETFSRVLRHLREHGLIAGTGNVLNLPQPHALQSVAGC